MINTIREIEDIFKSCNCAINEAGRKNVKRANIRFNNNKWFCTVHLTETKAFIRELIKEIPNSENSTA